MPQFNLMLNLLLLALLWGPSFLFLKIGVTEVPPITLVTLRLGFSALCLFVFLKFKKISLPRDFILWKHCFFMGVISCSAPFILYGYSLKHIDSILSGLINGTTPITTLLLAHYFLKNEPLTANRVMGVTASLVGFLILFIPSCLKNGFSGDSLGILLSLLAAACYAVGMVYARRFITPPPQPLVLPLLQFTTSLFYLIPLSLIFDPPLNPSSVSVNAWQSILGLSILGTVFAFILYYKIVMRYGATALSTTTYLLALISTLFGVVFLKEPLTPSFCLAALFILLGIMVANNVISLSNLRRLKLTMGPLTDNFPADK